ncbi:hypothetical protein ACFYXP_26850 [Streptomyces sp. NPDC002466]|uniref:hypothetical protein n=1 Tax=unclassified Streptomyces TaxID=2593676 RepID=UPI0035DC5F09
MSTSRPAETPRLPLPTAGRHTTAPREAGPVTRRRHGRSVLHTRTAPGTALPEGVPPRAVHFRVLDMNRHGPTGFLAAQVTAHA